jgi:hypothetical protein
MDPAKLQKDTTAASHMARDASEKPARLRIVAL